MQHLYFRPRLLIGRRGFFYLAPVNYVAQIFQVFIVLVLLRSLWKDGRQFARKLRIRIRGVRTQGTVISSRTEKSNDDTRFYTTVRFRTDLMQNIEAECPESRMREVPAGTEVTIFYDPKSLPGSSSKTGGSGFSR
ncbi:MAG: DUF3592 domain-containing protein [Chitinophagaceae bacterium]|nr:MAG: DUF3592 domain-containing protein [Chitinophagaceae bacterium]